MLLQLFKLHNTLSPLGSRQNIQIPLFCLEIYLFEFINGSCNNSTICNLASHDIYYGYHNEAVRETSRIETKKIIERKKYNDRITF